MPKNKKAPGDEGSRKMKGQPNITIDDLNMCEFAEVELTGEEWEAARKRIHRAMIFNNGTDRFRFNLDLSDDQGTVLDFMLDSQLGPQVGRLLLPGWVPRPRHSVFDVLRDFEALYNGDPDTDAVVNTMTDRHQAKTLLTDFSKCREAASDILRERKSRDAICARYMAELRAPSGWDGIIPKAASISMLIPVRIRKVN